MLSEPANAVDVSRPDLEDAAGEAVSAVRVGLWVSATRCVLTYLVAPALGALGVLLGPVGLLLQVAGAVTSTSGARTLVRLHHRLRWPYVVVAAAVDLVAVVAVLDAVRGGGAR